MYILGLSYNYHDSAAALLKDGEIVGAVQEERFTRRKHDPSFPGKSIEFLLQEAGLRNINQVEQIAYYENPRLKLNRIIESYIACTPAGWASFRQFVRTWLGWKLFPNREIRLRLGYEGQIEYVKHHQSHAASAFYPSPFEAAAIMVVDGVGEWDTTSVGFGNGTDLTLSSHIEFPHSLGLLYSAITHFIGFKINSGEYKVMGLAPYGKPKYAQLFLDNLIDIRSDGSFQLNMLYFNHCVGLTPLTPAFEELLGRLPRTPETEITQDDMDIACSIQAVLEIAIENIARYALLQTGSKNLCMAGGVALNCVANGKLVSKRIAEKIWVQPASGDAGGALGAALDVHYRRRGAARPHSILAGDHQRGSLLGPRFDDDDIQEYLTAIRIRFCHVPNIENTVAELLAQQQVIGWFNDRMEFGPRSLGSRSILGDPRDPSMQRKMNLKIKFRESFRPFAPIVLAEEYEKWFDLNQRSDYMLIVAPVSKKVRTEPKKEKIEEGLLKLNSVASKIPAVTHVDFSARVQTVSVDTNPVLHRLLNEFFEITGCPVLINTSFNVRGEPVVCTPEDAFKCFMRTNIDYLVLNNFLVRKADMPKWQDEGWRKEYALD